MSKNDLEFLVEAFLRKFQDEKWNMVGLEIVTRVLNWFLAWCISEKLVSSPEDSK